MIVNLEQVTDCGSQITGVRHIMLLNWGTNCTLQHDSDANDEFPQNDVPILFDTPLVLCKQAAATAST